METPVNFDNLHAITGGDAGIEAMLFASFLMSAMDCLDHLHAALAAGDEGHWRQQAHAFKGISLNLGAAKLGTLCDQAQNDCRATSEEKRVIIAAIEHEFARVREALDRMG